MTTLPVPNKPPTVASPRRIMIVGEAPDRDDVKIGEPFTLASGYTGSRLNKLLEIAGHSRNACFLANVSQHQPPLIWNSPNIQLGLQQLKHDVTQYNPNLILLLGNAALKAAMDSCNLLSDKASPKVSNWRGSLFVCTDPSSPFLGRKCLATYHPSYCLRDFDKMPLLMFDIKKAVRHSSTPELVLPQRTLNSQPTYEETCSQLSNLLNHRSLVALDIEGGINSMSCISFATSPGNAFIVPLSRKSGGSYYTDTEEQVIWRLLAQVLESPLIPKVLQNSLYDRFVLAYSYGIRVQGVVEDTMLKHWELYSELPKSLGVQTSLYTDEPYYKQERKSNDDKTFYEYCCKDSAVTLEISNTLDRYLTGISLTHYRLNVELLNPLLYMELRGIRYNIMEASARRTLLQQKLYEAQARLNTFSGNCLEVTQQITDLVYSNLLYKKAPPNLTPNQWIDYAYSDKKKAHRLGRLITLTQLPNPTLATLGEVEACLGLGVNLASNPQMCEFLYATLRLPPQFADATKKKGEGDDEEEDSDDEEEIPIDPADRTLAERLGITVPPKKRISADYECLLKLAKYLSECKDSLQTTICRQVIQLAIEIRSLATRQRMLGISADQDGRIRCGYNIVGSNTGRITCYESPTGSGYNLQTIPNYTSTTDAPGGVLGDRDLFTADDGFWFFQCDLKGADGWTVAAYSAMLGDRTMLDDYLFGLKPANIITLMLRGVQVDFRDRAALKSTSKAVEKDAWDYFACKRVQHGASYLEGPLTTSRLILKDSEGKCNMPVSECKQLLNFFFQRYWGVRKYHDYIGRQLKANRGTPFLTAASGQKRYFFGRPDEILTKAVAFEPQANTTYATNLAMQKLWNDNENRIPTERNNAKWVALQSSGSSNDTPSLATKETQEIKLRIEPLHQVHDALCGQFSKLDTAWSLGKIRSYFQNPIRIAGVELVIPFDGGYGKSWGNLKEGVI